MAVSWNDSERVLIVGGGPAGMATAMFLAMRGVPVTLFEKAFAPFDDPRAATYHPPSLELLEDSGVTAELVAAGIMSHLWQVRDRRQGVVAEFDLRVLAADTPFPCRLHLEQHKLVAMMEKRVAASASVDLRRGVVVEAITHDESSVAVHVVNACGTRETVHGRWVIGADGGRSVVRGSQQIGFNGFSWQEHFLVVTTTFDFAQLGFATSSYSMDPSQWVATFKVPGDGSGVWRCLFPVRGGEWAEEGSVFQVAAEQLEAFVPEARGARILHTNLYSVHQRVATTFRKDRVFLVGDAAHVNNPLGGMGLNFGLHDAANLAETLAAVWHGTLPESTLDRYDRQRRTVAERHLQRLTIAAKQLLEIRDPELREARKNDLRGIASDPARAREYLLDTSMIAGMREAATIA